MSMRSAKKICVSGLALTQHEWGELLGYEESTVRGYVAKHGPVKGVSRLLKKAEARALLDENTPPGAPGSSTWSDLAWDDDPWAQSLVISHPTGMTLEEVGAALGITKERVRQIEEVALRKIRRRFPHDRTLIEDLELLLRVDRWDMVG